MIEKDYSKDNLFDELGMKRLKDSYMRNDENSPQDRFEFVANKFASNEEHAKRLYEYMSNHWLSCSTPILSYGKNKNNLPISCFLPWLEDTSKGLVDTFSEVSWLSMAGGGVGVGVGIRSADDKSVGIMPHLKTYDASMLAYKQGNRRGSYAMYLDISHPDIIQFIEMRKPTGDPLLRCQNLNHGINIPDEFMELIENVMKDENFDDSWELKDPNNGKVREVVSARYLWQKILETRMLTGEPMIHFISTSNKMMPEYQKKLGLKIRQSNLCSEITLPTDTERTAVCCLSSLNLEYYDDWKDNDIFIRDVAEMLDNVLDVFINDAPDVISKAKFSAMRERSIGIGTLGFHAYLQKNNIPFESASAVGINRKIFKNIYDKGIVANSNLSNERGEAPDAEGYGKRFSTMFAIAPNACQSKDNRIKLENDVILSVREILNTYISNYKIIEKSGKKCWVNLDKSFKVPTLDGSVEVDRMWYNGMEQLFEIEFEDGEKYKFTGNHLLMVMLYDGDIIWKMVKDLDGTEEIISV